MAQQHDTETQQDFIRQNLSTLHLYLTLAASAVFACAAVLVMLVEVYEIVTPSSMLSAVISVLTCQSYSVGRFCEDSNVCVAESQYWCSLTGPLKQM